MLLAWLILTKTVNAMRMYSRLLLHSCLMASSLKIFYTLKSSGYSNRYCIYARSAYSGKKFKNFDEINLSTYKIDS